MQMSVCKRIKCSGVRTLSVQIRCCTQVLNVRTQLQYQHSCRGDSCNCELTCELQVQIQECTPVGTITYMAAQSARKNAIFSSNVRKDTHISMMLFSSGGHGTPRSSSKAIPSATQYITKGNARELGSVCLQQMQPPGTYGRK